MNRKAFLCGALMTMVGVGAVATALTASKTDIAQGVGAEWTHFNGVAPTVSGKGTKEYWVNCSDYSHVFEKPSSSSIREGEALPRSFVDSLPEDDDRLVPSYAEIIGFEDGNVPLIFQNTKTVSSLSVVDGGTEGKKCLKIAVGGDYGIRVLDSYFDAVFSDPSVQSVFFHAKADVDIANFRISYQGTAYTFEHNNTGWGLNTVWKAFEIKRSDYVGRAASDATILGYNTAGSSIYIDNIVPSKTAMNSYGFENGKVVSASQSYRTAGHADNRYERYVAPLEFIRCPSSYVTGFDFDYTIKSEGLRSLKVTKTNGYLAFFTLSNIKTLMGTGGRLTFDLYSSIAVNANPSVKNIMDGMNQPLGGTGYYQPKGQWVTYSFDASNITDDGRFLILNGSSAGDFYFDNFRISPAASSIDTEHLNREIFLCAPYSGVTNLDVTYDPKEGNQIKIDGALHKTRMTLTPGERVISIPNTQFKDLGYGEHTISLIYTDTDGVIREELYYITLYTGTTETAESLSLAYGDAGYTNINGIYEKLYRVIVNGKPVPFERLDNNDRYCIPNASLIECLPSVSGKKQSGTVNLFLITIDGVVVHPFNITLTGDTTELTLTQYNGEEMTTYGYSSTSHDRTNLTDAEAHTPEKLIEYTNVGFDVIYEQCNHMGTSTTALTAALKAEFDNAVKIGRKVMIVDDIFTQLARQTVSLIGNTITCGSKQFNFASEAELDAYVESRLSLYINEPGCYGIHVGDEESYAQLLGGYGETFRSLHRVLAKLNRTDFYTGSNLLPFSAGDDRLAGDDPLETHQENYERYLNTYLDVTQNTFICADYYPLTNWPNNGSDHDGSGLNYYTIKTLEVMAKVAKERGVSMYYVTQALSMDSTTVPGSNDRILNYEDASYLVNMLLGYGVKNIRFFTFYHRGSTGNESWLPNGCIMTADGQRTDYYYYVKSQLEQAKAMSKILSTFNYEWSHIDYTDNGLTNPWAYSWQYRDQTSASSYQKLQKYTIDKFWVNFYGLHNSETGQYMYGVQNLHREANENNLLQTIMLQFKDSNIKYFAVYENGSVRVVSATKYLTTSYWRITLKLSSGNTAFIVPYK